MEFRDAFRPGYISLDSSACMFKIGYDPLQREKVMVPNQVLAFVNY